VCSSDLETDEDFDQLLDFLDEAQIDRAGCFQYENVDGAVSAELSDHVDDETKEYRQNAFMEVQGDISAKRGARMIGRTVDVIVDENGEDGVLGRTKADAPEIDGVVTLTGVGADTARVGDIVSAEVTASDAYDLEARIIG